MRGHEFDRSPRVEEVPTRGQGTPRGTAAPVLVRPEDVEVVVDPRWLADLHDPSLVISGGYVGPDRRRSPRSGAVPPVRGTDGTGLFRRLAQVVAMTLAVVIPLGLINARSVPPATTTPGVASTATGSPAAVGTHSRTPRHTFGATPQQIARADAAYQRALARQESAPVPAAVAPAVTSVPVTPSATTAEAAPETQSGVGAAEARSATRASAADARAQARAAAAQRRVDRTTARSARDSGGGTDGTGPVTGGPPAGTTGGS